MTNANVTITGTLVKWTDANGQKREAYAKTTKGAARLARRIADRLAR